MIPPWLIPATPAHEPDPPAFPAPVTMAEHAEFYISRMGWSLCLLRPQSKIPVTTAWNDPSRYIDTVEKALAILTASPECGIGLLHESGHTATWDMDQLDYLRIICEEIGLNLDEMLSTYPRIRSRAGRDKLLFTVPADFVGTSKTLLAWPDDSGECLANGQPKMVTVFEFRGGANQDVLPPSIHPDTLKPYAWHPGQAPWDFPDGIPPMPAELLALWRDWPIFQKRLEAICPWRQAPEPPTPPIKRHLSHDGHGDIIGQFNNAVPCHEILERNGYQRKGKRWLCPSSSTKIPGVNLLEGKVFSHHASDPINNGHAHDAFSLLTILEHGGDINGAIRTAARMLGKEFGDPIPTMDFTEFLAIQKNKSAIKTIEQVIIAPPPEPIASRQDAIIPIPLLQEIADWIGGLYESPTHDISQAAALALASVTGGRIYRSESANWSSMLFVVSGASGVGKNYIKVGIERLLMHAGLTRMIAGDFYTHQSAIYWALRVGPTHICISDEFGENFMEARKNNNANKLTVFKSLKKVYSDADHIFKPESYAMGGMNSKQREENEMRPVINPALTLIGLTTPWQFFSEIKTAHIESGLINRFVIVNVDDGKQVHGKQNSDVPPAYLVEEIKRVRRVNDVLLHSAYDMAPPAIIVKINDDAHDVFNAMKDRQAEACGALEHATMDAMPRRWRENAMRMATALAPWHDHSRPIITGEIAAWCCEYVEHWGLNAIAAIRQQSGQNDYQSDMNRVLFYIRQAGEGVTDSDLSYRFRTIKRRDMADIKSHLSEAELAVQVKGHPGAKGGRPSVRWFATRIED